MTKKEESRLQTDRVIKEGFFGEVYTNFRLIIRLLKDSRVNFFLKLLPVGALIYLLFPLDVFPINPLDDAMIIWLGGYFFIELCPQDIVKEHLTELREPLSADPTNPQNAPDIVDAEFREIKD